MSEAEKKESGLAAEPTFACLLIEPHPESYGDFSRLFMVVLIVLVRVWWHRPCIQALGRQRQPYLY